MNNDLLQGPVSIVPQQRIHFKGRHLKFVQKKDNEWIDATRLYTAQIEKESGNKFTLSGRFSSDFNEIIQTYNDEREANAALLALLTLATEGYSPASRRREGGADSMKFESKPTS